MSSYDAPCDDVTLFVFLSILNFLYDMTTQYVMFDLGCMDFCI